VGIELRDLPEFCPFWSVGCEKAFFLHSDLKSVRSADRSRTRPTPQACSGRDRNVTSVPRPGVSRPGRSLASNDPSELGAAVEDSAVTRSFGRAGRGYSPCPSHPPNPSGLPRHDSVRLMLAKPVSPLRRWPVAPRRE
jgi:hypothetical protein